MYSYKILQNYSENMFHCSILRMENASYLFNCCDGTQRNALDMGIKFTKVKKILYSNNHIDSYLGTYGFILSRSEQNSNKNTTKHQNENKYAKKNLISKSIDNNINSNDKIFLFGPPKFSQNFLFSQEFCPVPIGNSIYEYDPKENKYQNKNILNYNNINIENLDEIKDENLKIIPICLNTNEDKNNYSMSYICIPHQKEAVFLPQKAKELGIKPGPLFSKLKKGENVTLDDGRIIQPKDVLGPLPKISALIIFFIPTIQHMNQLINENIVIKNYIESYEKNNIENSIVVTICDKLEIINNKEFKFFMKKFGKNTINIIDCKESNKNFMYNEGKIKINYILNKISNYYFRLSNFTQSDCINKNIKIKDIFDDEMKIEESFPNSEYILYPLEKRKKITKGLYNETPFYYESKDYKNFISNLSKNNIEINSINYNNISDNNNKNNIKITFLGTTSMKPCKFRNVSSILLEINDLNNMLIKNYVLLDCGEGTFQQIFEYYGKTHTNYILKNIKLIAITHKHGDHNLGLMKIISEIDKLLDDNVNNFIYLILPKPIIQFVINSINNDIIHKKYFTIIDCNKINPNQIQFYQEFLIQDDPYKNFKDIPKIKDYDEIKYKFNKIKKIQNDLYEDFYNKFGLFIYSVEVFHVDESYGFILENKEENIKISYSGDTRPNNNFFNLTFNSTVLIHECTFDFDMNKDAKEKMHSTVEDTINLFTGNKSKYLVLTHFSPRYIKTYPFRNEVEKYKILIAHDYLSFNIIDDDLENQYKYLKYFDYTLKEIEKCKENII